MSNANQLRSLEDWICLLLQRRAEAKAAIAGKSWELTELLSDALSDAESDVRRSCRILHRLAALANKEPNTKENDR